MQKFDIPNEIYTKDPQVDPTAFIAPGAHVMGDVILDAGSSVWYTAVLRGDINQIHVGQNSNVQDGSILHLENDRPCIVGDHVTIGHRAIIHGCTIEPNVLIGMGAIILNGAVIKKGAVIAAGAVVKENTIVPENTLMVGVPAKPVKVFEDSHETNRQWALKYVQVAKAHRERLAQDQRKKQ